MEVETCRAISFFAREGGREKMCAIFRPFQIKISAASRTMSEKKKTFVESRRGKKRESAPPCDALESINRYQNGAKNLSAARTSKNRGRLKSHKETEEEGGRGEERDRILVAGPERWLQNFFASAAHLQDGKERIIAN